MTSKAHLSLLLAASLAVGATLSAGAAAAATPTITRGVYSFWFPFKYDVKAKSYSFVDFSGPVANAILANMGVIGLVIDVPWDVLQPKPPGIAAFDPLALKELNQIIGEARMATPPLAVTLSIRAAEETTPSWVVGQSNPGNLVSTYDLNPAADRTCRYVDAPVPWDTAYEQARENFISELGSTYDGNPAIGAVTIAFSNWWSTDMVIPSNTADEQKAACSQYITSTTEPDDEEPKILGIADPGGTMQQQLQAVDTLLNNEGRQIVDAAVKAFPNEVIKLAIHEMPVYDANGTLLRNFVPYAVSSGIYLQQDSLSATSPTKNMVKGALPGSGEDYALNLLQAQCPSCTLQEGCPYSIGAANCSVQGMTVYQEVNQTIANGLTYNPPVLEFFDEDASNPALGPLFESATTSLGGTPR